MRLSIVATLALVAGCSKDAGDSAGSSGPREVTVPEIGIAVTAPADWAVAPGNGGTTRVASRRRDGVVLTRYDGATPTLEAATGGLGSEKGFSGKQLPNGVFELHWKVEFPGEGGGPPQLIDREKYLLSTGSHTVRCEFQQPTHDVAAVSAACASMRPLSP